MITATSSGQGIDYIIGVFPRHHESYPDMKHEVLTVVEDGGTAAGRSGSPALISASCATRVPAGSSRRPAGR